MSSGKRAIEGEVLANKPKRKPRVVSSRKWTALEVNSILDYMVETISNNSEIEKPTATAYYTTMIQKLNLHDVTPDKINAKVIHLKDSYIQAVNWHNQTGQMVLKENGAHAVKSNLLKICPNFDQLDRIYGCKSNQSLAYDLPESNKGSSYEYDFFDFLEAPKPVRIVTPSKKKQSEASEIEFRKAKLLGIKHAKELAPKKNETQSVLGFHHKSCKKPSVDEQRGIHEYRRKVKESEQNESKLKKEEKRISSEREWELKLEEKRIDNEKELRILEIEKDERVAMFRIEQDIKLQIELAKQKN